MRKTGLFVLLVVLVGVVGWFLVQSVSEVRADPKKTIPCGNITCLVNERCCILDFQGTAACFPQNEKCPIPLPVSTGD